MKNENIKEASHCHQLSTQLIQDQILENSFTMDSLYSSDTFKESAADMFPQNKYFWEECYQDLGKYCLKQEFIDQGLNTCNKQLSQMDTMQQMPMNNGIMNASQDDELFTPETGEQFYLNEEHVTPERLGATLTYNNDTTGSKAKQSLPNISYAATSVNELQNPAIFENSLVTDEYLRVVHEETITEDNYDSKLTAETSNIESVLQIEDEVLLREPANILNAYSSPVQSPICILSKDSSNAPTTPEVLKDLKDLLDGSVPQTSSFDLLEFITEDVNSPQPNPQHLNVSEDFPTDGHIKLVSSESIVNKTNVSESIFTQCMNNSPILKDSESNSQMELHSLQVPYSASTVDTSEIKNNIFLHCIHASPQTSDQLHLPQLQAAENLEENKCNQNSTSGKVTELSSTEQPSTSYMIVPSSTISASPLCITIKKESTSSQSMSIRQSPRKKRVMFTYESDEDDDPPLKTSRRSAYASKEVSECLRYRELRDKNNEASRRSRQTRKAREEEMRQEEARLEEENRKLTLTVQELEKELLKYRQAVKMLVLKCTNVKNNGSE